MTTDDPGWGGFISEDEHAPSAGLQDGQPGGLLPPAQAEPHAGALLPPDLARIEPESPVRNRRLTFILVVIAIGLGIVGGGAAGFIVAFSGHHSTATTTTIGGGTTTTSAGGTTTTSAGGNSEPALIGVVPSALSGTCSQSTSADFVATSVVDQVACATQSVSGSSADLIGYARFGSASALDAYFSQLLAANQLSSGAGNCSNADLSGSAPGGSFCEGSYTDSNGNSGNELLLLGSAFNVGGASGSAAAACQSAFPGSSGVSIIAWTSPVDDSVGFGVDCTNSSTQFVDGMQSNLVNAAYALND